MRNEQKKTGGISILGILLLGVILILILSYFHISLKAVVESPDAQNNINYVGGTSRSLWNDYLAKPVSEVLNSNILKTLWNSFVSNMQKIQNGQPTDLQKLTPAIPH